MLLLDVSMPGVDGLELCRTLRSLPHFSELPIIMLTGRDTVFDKVQGRLAGATEYLTKPFEIKQLREACSRLVSYKSSTTVQ
jgi:twitching motility two-component system response regulator PilG